MEGEQDLQHAGTHTHSDHVGTHTKHKFLFLFRNRGAGEMAQSLKALATLAEVQFPASI